MFFDKESTPVSLPSRPDLIIPPITPFYPSMRFPEWITLFDRLKVSPPAATTNTNNNNNDKKGKGKGNSKAAEPEKTETKKKGVMEVLL